MAEVDPNLVRAIAEQVMAALRGVAGSGQVQVHAPIGVCTGDYSKFPELRGMQSSPPPAASPRAASVAPTPAANGGRLDGTMALPPEGGGGRPHPSHHQNYAAPANPLANLDGTQMLPPERAGIPSPERHPATIPTQSPSPLDGTQTLPPDAGPVRPAHAPLNPPSTSPVAGGRVDGTMVLPPQAAPVAVTALKGVITVSHLRDLKGPIRLAKGAILTPLAQDYIRDKHLNIMTDEGAPTVRVNGGAAPSSTQMFWWIDGQCSSVAKVVESLRPNVLASREKGSPENLRQVIKELATLVKNRKVSGGMLFVGSAARTICYANRCASLRAIVGTSDKSVSEGIELLGANVLVIEYPMHGAKSMGAMVKPFVESLQVAPAAVQKELDELRMCG